MPNRHQKPLCVAFSRTESEKNNVRMSKELKATKQEVAELRELVNSLLAKKKSK